MGNEQRQSARRLFYKGSQHADVLEEERQKAIESYLARTANDEVHADPYINLGFLYLEQESYEEALKCFSKVKELEPGNTDNYNNMGYTYEKMACLASAR
jgi:tetratricopeptide (TPR) repeat protein